MDTGLKSTAALQIELLLLSLRCFGSLTEIVGSQVLNSAFHPTAEPKSTPISEYRCSPNGQMQFRPSVTADV